MSAPPENDEARGRRASAQSEQQGNYNNSGGRPEAQGNRIQRNPSQAPPLWPDPPGADAADLLDELTRGWPR